MRFLSGVLVMSVIHAITFGAGEAIADLRLAKQAKKDEALKKLIDKE